MKKYLLLLIAAIAIGTASCGTRALDYPLASQQKNEDRRSIDLSRDGTLVVMAFSGGGSRAAALAASVTGLLDTVTYSQNGASRRLSEDIGVVSSVSGGSVYATYLALHGTSKGEADAFNDQIQKFDGFGYLEGRFLNPLTWVNLQLQNTTRVDVLKEMLGQFLGLKSETLSVLNQPRRPVVLLNASDLVAGQAFTFDPKALDDLCMHYDTTPLVLATTASAAFPGAFTPVLLKNDSYPKGCAGTQIPLGDLANQLNIPGGRYADLESFRYARYRDSLRAGSNSFRKPEFVRLVDGGVVDNLGLTSIRFGLIDPASPFDLNRLMQARIKNLVVIVVNARSDKRNDLDSSPEYTTIGAILGNVSGVLVDSASAGSAAIFRAFVTNLALERNAMIRDGLQNARFNIYPVTIDFDQLPSSNDTERKFLDAVKSIETNWTLKNGDVAMIQQAATELLWREPCFRDLVKNLGGTVNPNVPAVEVICTAPPLP